MKKTASTVFPFRTAIGCEAGRPIQGASPMMNFLKSCSAAVRPRRPLHSASAGRRAEARGPEPAPSINDGLKPGSASFTGGTLVCKCKDHPVKVKIASQVFHNHACGCTKCWKPEGADLLGGGRGAARAPSASSRTATSWPSSIRRRPSSATPARSAAPTCTAASRTRRTCSTASTSSTPSCSTPPGQPAGIRGLRLLDHRERRAAEQDGRDPRAS